MKERIRQRVLDSIRRLVGVRKKDQETAIVGVMQSFGMAIVGGVPVDELLNALVGNSRSLLVEEGWDILKRLSVPHSLLTSTAEIKATQSIENVDILRVLSTRTKFEFQIFGGRRIFGHLGMNPSSAISDSVKYHLREFDEALKHCCLNLLPFNGERRKRSQWLHPTYLDHFWWYSLGCFVERSDAIILVRASQIITQNPSLLEILETSTRSRM